MTVSKIKGANAQEISCDVNDNINVYLGIGRQKGGREPKECILLHVTGVPEQQAVKYYKEGLKIT